MDYYRKTTSQAEQDADELMAEVIKPLSEYVIPTSPLLNRALTQLHGAVEERVYDRLITLLDKRNDHPLAHYIYTLQTWREE